MANNSEPHDAGTWGDYVKGGRGHFDRVGRSFNVFGRNTQELFDLLRDAETDFLSSMRLMEITGFEAEDGARFREEFWGELDQRLHNMVSSAVAVVDHTRPLLAFYEHEPEFVAERGERSEEVAKSPRALFLRRLRNYLLHYGMAPLMRSMVLGPPKEVRTGMTSRSGCRLTGCCATRAGTAATGSTSTASKEVHRCGRSLRSTART